MLTLVFENEIIFCVLASVHRVLRKRFPKRTKRYANARVDEHFVVDLLSSTYADGVQLYNSLAKGLHVTRDLAQKWRVNREKHFINKI